MEGELKNGNTLPDESCLRFETGLAAYLEGEERLELLAHAEHCEFCRCILADLQRIRHASSEMSLESPSPAMWGRVREILIAEGIITKRRRFWQRWLSATDVSRLRTPVPLGVLAAAAIAAVVLLRSPSQPIRPRVPQVPPGRAAVQGFMPPADVELRRTIQQLEQAYHANESQIEPSMKETYRKSLNSLNDEIRECETSMQQDPGNGLVHQYLSAAYTEKAQLLQSALEFDLR